LQVTGSHVVETRIAENVWTHILVRPYLVNFLADHDCEFPFEVDALRKLRPADFTAGREQRRRRLEEDQRLNRDLIAQFRSMFTIVATYANDL